MLLFNQPDLNHFLLLSVQSDSIIFSGLVLKAAFINWLLFKNYNDRSPIATI